MEQSISIGEMAAAFRRRLPLLVLVTSIGLGASIHYASRQPSMYRTSTRVLVERQQIPDELARSTVNLTTSQRLQLVEERLMARDNLIAIIARLDLFADAPDLPLDRKIQLVRAATRIESISGVNPGQSWGNEAGIFAFTITVESTNPREAAALANEFAALALAQNAQVRNDRARETLQYFDREVDRLVDEILALEGQIATYKVGHDELLPDGQDYRREELARLQLSELDIVRQISDLQNEQGVLSVEAASAATSPQEMSVAETELRQLELQLAQRRRLLGARHPEIGQLERRVDALADVVAAERAQVDAAPTEGESAGARAAMRTRIAQIAEQISVLEAQRAGLQERRVALDAAIRGTPEVEARLAAYNRDLVELQEQHSVAARRLAEARTGAQLEASEQAERFEIVEKALVPTEAVGPDRKKIVILGGGASAALAVALATLLEFLRPVLRSSAQMERQLGIRPVVSIPHVTTTWDVRRRWMKIATAAAVLVGVLTIAAPPLVGSFALPVVIHDASLRLAQVLARLGLGS